MVVAEREFVDGETGIWEDGVVVAGHAVDADVGGEVLGEFLGGG